MLIIRHGWADNGNAAPFPGGESREEAEEEKKLTGFDKAVTGDDIRRGISQAALVIHGGTIMNIMEEYARDSQILL